MAKAYSPTIYTDQDSGPTTCAACGEARVYEFWECVRNHMRAFCESCGYDNNPDTQED